MRTPSPGLASILTPVLTLLVTLLVAPACGGGDGDASDAPTTIDTIAVDGPPELDAAPVCSAAPSYGSVTDPAGTFLANYDDNGSGPGDPIPDNDVMLVSSTLRAGPPTDLLFVNLVEGIATFSDAGAVRDFASFELPLVIDIGATPEEQDYDTCGTCLSMLNDVTLADGEVTAYQVQLIARSGTITITELPSQAGDTFTATLDDVAMAQIDFNGDLVPAGCTTTIDGVALSAIAAAP